MISRKEYKALLDDSLLLCALQGAGVDNWDGYDYAIKDYNEMKEDQNKKDEDND